MAIKIAGTTVIDDSLNLSNITTINGTDWATVVTGAAAGSDIQLNEVTDVTIGTLDTGQVLVWDGSAWVNSGFLISDIQGTIADAQVTSSNVTQHQADLSITESQISDFGTYETADATILKDADIGATVEAFDATILKDADIGVTVEAHDVTILKDADIGVNVEAFDATILKAADIGVTVEAHDNSILKSIDIGVSVEPHDNTILKDADIGVNIQAFDADLVSDGTYVKTDENFTTADHSKLAGIEAGATADQTALEIKTAYESNADTNEFSDDEQTKLAGIETAATADQTGAQIKVAYEAEADTNAFTDSEKTKLGAIESAATADQTGSEIKAAYEAEADTNAYNDAAVTKLGGIEALADVTDTANVTAAGAVMDSELTAIASVKALDQGVATTDSPTFVEVNATTFDVATNIEVGQYIDLQTTVATKPAHAEGRVFYDEAFGALAVYNDEADITLQVGQEEYIRVYNNTGATISNGIPVYLTGEVASTPTIAVARADGTYEQSQAVGIATHDIENASTGYVTVRGLIADVDTTALTVGQKVYVAVGASGGVQTDSPTYPNFPTEVGICLISGVAGCIYVYVQTEALETLRVTGNSHFDANVTIDGDLTILGNQTIASSSNVSIANAWNYFNSGDTIGALNTTFTGTGLDDMDLTGHFEGTSTTNYYVRIDSVGGGTGGVDTFEWSTDNFATFVAQDVDITGSDQLIHSTDNISVNFNATTGHTLGDVWTGTGSPINVDTGFASNRNTGTSGVGYTHVGIFYDVSTNKWTVFDEYGPEPEGTIDTTDASFSLGTILAGNFEGPVTGNVTGSLVGNASTASALETGRTITLSGDVTGSVSFNGAANVNITTTVGDDSHGHTNATTSAGGFMSAADKSKIDGIEAGATAGGQDAAEIKSLYESNADTNVFTDADHTKLNAIEASADVTDTANVVAALTAGSNITIDANGTISGAAPYTHPANHAISVITGLQAALDGKVDDSQVLTNVPAGALFTDTNTTYSVGDGGLSEINFTSADHTKLNGIATSANNYSHPTYAGDDLSVDTGVLSGATVISDLDFNVTTDTLGHVTDANATFATRNITLANLGYTGASNANYITNNSQLTNDAGYTTNVGDITGVTAGSGLSGGGNSGTVTINHADTSAQGSVNNSGRTYIQDITLDTYGHITGIVSATETVVNTDTNTTYSAGAGMSLSGTTFNCNINTPAEVGLGNLSSSGNNLAGNFTATGNITAYSDIRVKTDIEVIPSALDKVSALRGVTYERTDVVTPRQTGVIAQEVLEVLPEAVMADEAGNLSVAYGQMVGLLIESIKELTAKVEKLEGAK